MPTGPAQDERARRREHIRRHHRLQGIDAVRIEIVGRCVRVEILFIPPWPGVAKHAVPERLSAHHLAVSREGDGLAFDVAEWVAVPEEFLVRFLLCPHGGLRHGERWTLEISGIPDLDPGFSSAEIVIELHQPRPDSRSYVPLQPRPPAAPVIDYLAKDYESFRRSILERIRRYAPEWRGASEADIGVVLAELLAYAGDRLSYWQDAVATEAYLKTARLRASAVRHARLLDYHPFEGRAPRVWVHVSVNAEGVPLPLGTVMLTGLEGQPTRIPVEIYGDRNLTRIFSGVEVFETLADATLYTSHQVLEIAGGLEGREWMLPAGATSASVRGAFPGLHAGDALLLEQVDHGTPEGVPAPPHLVVLARDPEIDHPADSEQAATRLEWRRQDALPRDFPVRERLPDGRWAGNITVFRGNLVRAQLGRAIENERLPRVPSTGAYRPALRAGPVLYAAPLSSSGSSHTEPCIQLIEDGPAGERHWRARRDLMESHPWSRDFVVENGPVTVLRFGDGQCGRVPQPGTSFKVSYRVGDVRRGFVAANAVRHVVSDDERLLAVRNPLAAGRGAAAETLGDIQRAAPQAHLVQERCVTAEDYVDRCRDLPDVRDAAVQMDHHEAHNRITVYIDRGGDRPADREFRAAIRRQLEPYRLLGSSVHVRPPEWFALLLELEILVAPEAVRASVERALRRAFLGNPLRHEETGLFLPGSFAFGQPVLSGVILETAMEVPGVASAVIARLQRWSEYPAAQAPPDRLAPAAHEIVRLSDDPHHPEHGQLVLRIRGGRA